MGPHRLSHQASARHVLNVSGKSKEQTQDWDWVLACDGKATPNDDSLIEWLG